MTPLGWLNHLAPGQTITTGWHLTTAQGPPFPLLLNLIPALHFFAPDKHPGGGCLNMSILVFCFAPLKRTPRGRMGFRKCITPSPSGEAFEKPSPFPSLRVRWDTVTPKVKGSSQYNRGYLLHGGICRKIQRNGGVQSSLPSFQIANIWVQKQRGFSIPEKSGGC